MAPCETGRSRNGLRSAAIEVIPGPGFVGALVVGALPTPAFVPAATWIH